VLVMEGPIIRRHCSPCGVLRALGRVLETTARQLAQLDVARPPGNAWGKRCSVVG
jgi:hypothetical protein